MYQGETMKLKSKAEFVKAAAQGLCGNVLKQFNTLRELDDWQWSKDVVCTARAREKWNTGLFIPEVDFSHIGGDPSFIMRMAYPKHDWAACYFQEVPLIDRVLNFELGQGIHYPLRYGAIPPVHNNLRLDLDTHGTERTGAGYHLWLADVLEGEYEHLREIWELYPDAIIEATMFSKPCGTLNRKLVIWEVRDY
jgi:hypothetical protein